MKHNHAVVWLLVFGQLILTVIWRSPLLFYNTWIAEQGRKTLEAPTEDNLPFVTVVIALIILNYFLSWLTNALNKSSFKEGLLTGLLLTAGFAAPLLAMNYKLLDISNVVLLIDLGLASLILIVSSGLMAMWRKQED